MVSVNRSEKISDFFRTSKMTPNEKRAVTCFFKKFDFSNNIKKVEMYTVKAFENLNYNNLSFSDFVEKYVDCINSDNWFNGLKFHFMNFITGKSSENLYDLTMQFVLDISEPSQNIKDLYYYHVEDYYDNQKDKFIQSKILDLSFGKFSLAEAWAHTILNDEKKEEIKKITSDVCKLWKLASMRKDITVCNDFVFNLIINHLREQIREAETEIYKKYGRDANGDLLNLQLKPEELTACNIVCQMSKIRDCKGDICLHYRKIKKDFDDIAAGFGDYFVNLVCSLFEYTRDTARDNYKTFYNIDLEDIIKLFGHYELQEYLNAGLEVNMSLEFQFWFVAVMKRKTATEYFDELKEADKKRA